MKPMLCGKQCAPRLVMALILGCAMLLLISPAVSAQSADKIIKQGIKAMGGEKALQRVTAWRTSGSITRKSDGAAGRYQAAAMRPDLYFLGVEIRGFEASEGFNGKSGWQRDSRDGLRTLTGAESAYARTEAVYRNNRWLNYQKEKSKLAYAGQAEVKGKPAHAIVLTTIRNVKLKLFFDATSGLLVKEELPEGDGVKAFEYANHRAVNGVMEPFAITLIDGGEQFEIALEEVKHNQPLDRALFDFPKVSNEALPDIPALLKQVSDNQQAIDALLEKYTFTQTITEREFDQKGALKEKETSAYDLTFYRGRRVRRLIEKNGKQLSADEQEKQLRQLEKTFKEIDKQEAEKEKKEREAAEKGKAPNNEKRVTIADVLSASRLVNPRREQFRHRDVIVFDFEPNLQLKPKTDTEKLMQKFSGAVWVDAADRQVVRLEARLIDSYKIGGGMVASIKPGAAFVLEQDRINDEIWLPSYSEFNLSVRIFLLAGFSANQVVKYSDYKRFNVESEKEKIKTPGVIKF